MGEEADFLNTSGHLIEVCSSRAKEAIENAGIMGISFSPAELIQESGPGRWPYWVIVTPFEFEDWCFRLLLKPSVGRFPTYCCPVVQGLDPSRSDVYIGTYSCGSVTFFSERFVDVLKRGRLTGWDAEPLEEYWIGAYHDQYKLCTGAAVVEFTHEEYMSLLERRRELAGLPPREEGPRGKRSR